MKRSSPTAPSTPHGPSSSGEATGSTAPITSKFDVGAVSARVVDQVAGSPTQTSAMLGRALKRCRIGERQLGDGAPANNGEEAEPGGGGAGAAIGSGGGGSDGGGFGHSGDVGDVGVDAGHDGSSGLSSGRAVSGLKSCTGGLIKFLHRKLPNRNVASTA
mmetsp:Transcript_6453/g.11217  ORF Transcript_6453/g.11217 Transcript_6453/m.11217 type:complete len:160 (+) Transcript_6453:228-707(+)